MAITIRQRILDLTGIRLLLEADDVDEEDGIVNPNPDEKDDAERFVCVIFVYNMVGLSITVFLSNFLMKRFMF